MVRVSPVPGKLGADLVVRTEEETAPGQSSDGPLPAAANPPSAAIIARRREAGGSPRTNEMPAGWRGVSQSVPSHPACLSPTAGIRYR